MKNMSINSQIRSIIGCSFKVYNTLGFGFLESVYQKALVIELGENDLDVKSECPIDVLYEGHKIGKYYTDLIVNDEIIIELKSIKEISQAHESQLVNYLTATGIETGLTLNFAEQDVQIKRKYRQYNPRSNTYTRMYTFFD